MAGSKGYRNYRGRVPRGRIVLTGLLVLVILAAMVVILLQRHIVYDETGLPHLELPWQEEGKEEPVDVPDVEGLDLIIEEEADVSETVMTIRGLFLPEMPMHMQEDSSWLQLKADTNAPYDAVAVCLKDDTGKVWFDASAAITGAVKTGEDTMQALREITDSSYYSIAQIACLHDPKAALDDVDGKGLKNTGGYIFYDGNNSQWLDPSKPATREYLCSLISEAVALGFDEILLTDVGYPTVGKLDKVDDGGVVRAAEIATLLEELRAVLPEEVCLSVELPMQTVLTGKDEISGHILKEIAKRVDAIYAQGSSEECAEADEILKDTGCVFIPQLTVYDPFMQGSFLIQ